MKTLYLVGGPPGAGKTTSCRILAQMLQKSVFLDGDTCWDTHPFMVTEETKRMVVVNICFLLNSFIACSAIERIVFCWVMHEQSIIDDILSRLELSNVRVIPISLVCSEEALTERIERDIAAGMRCAHCRRNDDEARGGAIEPFSAAKQPRERLYNS